MVGLPLARTGQFGRRALAIAPDSCFFRRCVLGGNFRIGISTSSLGSFEQLGFVLRAKLVVLRPFSADHSASKF
jgi:hypothetical protein